MTMSGRSIGQNRIERGHGARSGLRQRLAWQHEVQVVIGSHTEGFQHLVEHAPVLGRHADAHPIAFRKTSQMEHYRAELDGLRPGAEE